MKKVLIIAYYWPPAGGPGVQRWLLFVKYLRDFGIEPVVYVPQNPNYPFVDTSLEKEIPKGVTVLKQPIKEPYRLARLFSSQKTAQISKGIIPTKKQSFTEKILLWLRGNFFIPDARIAWVKPSVAFLKEYLQKEKIETVITTGPPHSLHLIGLKLKQQLNNLRWIADFRDPWTTIGYHKKLKLTEAAAQKHQRLEAEVLQTADDLLVTSPTTQEEFRKKTNQPITVITNGFDGDISTEKIVDKKFTMSHIGSLLSDRNPEVLWSVLSELVTTDPDFATDFRLQLVGVVSDTVLQSLSEYALGNHIEYKGYLNHTEVRAVQCRSQVLLLIEIDSEETRAIIPGKLFEYMAANRPIIALGPQSSDVERILEETESGLFFEYNQKEKLKNTLLDFYQHYKNGTLVSTAKNMEHYHRKQLTKKLANILHQQ